MNANLKTLTFVVAAVAVALLAWIIQPSSLTTETEDYSNTPLYPEMKNPLDVADLEIVKYDESRGELIPFRVAQVESNGKRRWSIPSHENYPADAKDQVAQAAGGLMGLKIVDMASENVGDQQEYGVVEPNANVLKLGATGVGDKIVMKNAAGKEMLALIIGKEVPGRPNLRYVRKVGESQIYTVAARTDRLSTKFENWIEPNLLQINTMDLKELLIRDYSVDVMNGTLNQRSRMAIDYSAEGEQHWKIANDERFAIDEKNPAGDRWTPVKMAADEEVNAAKLDELKTALDDLKIVNVNRKPIGLSADLQASANFTKNREAIESLARKGFFVAKLGKQVELFSNEGEIRLVMRDGVEYVLRFGQIAGNSPTEKKEKAKDKDGKEPDDEKSAGLNRYLFVMAEFNTDAIPKPVFEPMPEPKKEADAAKKPDEKKADEKKPDAKDAKPDEKKADEKKADETKADEKALAAQREQIEKDNKRKQEEYDRQIADGKKRVAELNARFADWYYVISDSVYKKIHLSRDEIVQKKEKKSEKDAKGENGLGGLPGIGGAQDDHTGHDHADATDKPEEKTPATPVEELEKLKKEGPAAK